MLSKEEIRELIRNDVKLTALLPNSQAIAEKISKNRVTYVPTEIGTGTIIEVLGFEVGNQVLDVIHSHPTYRHVVSLLNQGTLRLDSLFVRTALQNMVPDLLTQEQKDLLASRAQVPDPVSEYEVRCAIFNDDGSIGV